MAKKEASIKFKKDEEIKWKAEGLVRDALVGTSEFKRAVKETIRELKRIDKVVRSTLKK